MEKISFTCVCGEKIEEEVFGKLEVAVVLLNKKAEDHIEEKHKGEYN